MMGHDKYSNVNGKFEKIKCCHRAQADTNFNCQPARITSNKSQYILIHPTQEIERKCFNYVTSSTTTPTAVGFTVSLKSESNDCTPIRRFVQCNNNTYIIFVSSKADEEKATVPRTLITVRL